MNLRVFLTISGFFYCIFCTGQSSGWEKVFTISKPNIDLVDIDNNGKILLADNSGNLTQYDESGDSINHYSPAYQSKLRQLEARRSLNIFIFSSDLQRFEILDRFLKPLSSGLLSGPDFGNIKTASLGNNRKMWLYDETDFSLIQYDYQTNSILQKQTLNLIIENLQQPILEITEYQNIVFINIKERGIYLFDNQANFIKHLPILTEEKLCFFDNRILTVNGDDKLISTNYLSGNQKSYTLPLKGVNISAGHDLIILYNAKSLNAYRLPLVLL